MNPSEFSKEIELASQRLGMGRRELFDSVISFGCSYVCLNPDKLTHLYQDMRYSTQMVCKPDVELVAVTDDDYVQLLSYLMMALTQVMKNGDPFEDLLTAIYSEYLQGDAGQFMSPAYFGKAIMQFISDEQAFQSGMRSTSEPTCGTGTLALGMLQEVYEKDGRVGIANVDLHLNDLDIRLVKVAMFQVMYHSIERNIPLGRIVVECKNLITEYYDDHTIFSCQKASDIEREIAIVKMLSAVIG